jgi:hypothetical protein
VEFCRRRNVSVFTPDLALYTIEHGSDKKSAGPDLLLSYHDNDHYNSVRNSRASKPPPPIKTYSVDPGQQDSADVPDSTSAVTADETADAIDNEMELDRASPTDTCTTSVSEPDADMKDQSTESTSSSQLVTKQNPKGPCSCGSGLRYKKCCGVRKSSKKQERAVRSKSPKATLVDREEQIMDGTFRVLHI